MKQETVTGRAAMLAAVGRGQSEQDFQREVIAYAKKRGWTVFFTWNSRHSPAGEPDLRLVREKVVWAELKGYDARGRLGRLTALQSEAIGRLSAAGAEVYVWNPGDWEGIERVLGV